MILKTTISEKIKLALEADIIGDVEFSDCEISEINDYLRNAVGSFAERATRYFYAYEVECLIVAIVHYARNWGNVGASKASDENRHFFSTLTCEIFDTPDVWDRNGNRLYESFVDVFEKHNKPVFISKGNRRMFTEVFKFHSFAPLSSINAFTELIWGYYSDEDFINFTKFSDDTYKHIIDRIYVYLKQKFSIYGADMDAVVDLGGNTYEVRAALKYAFQYAPECVCKSLIRSTFLSLDTKHRSFQSIDNNCFERLIQPKVQHLVVERKKRGSSGGGVNRSGIITRLVDLENMSVAYQYNEGDGIFLSMPDILLYDESVDDAELRVLSSGSIVCTYALTIFGREFKKKIKSASISLRSLNGHIDNIFDLCVELWVDGQMRYTSNASLLRNFLLFSTSGKEIRSNAVPGEYILLLPFGVQSCDTNVEISKRAQTGEVHIIAHEGDHISFNKRTTFFSKKSKNVNVKYIGENKGSGKAVFVKDDIEYQIWNKLDSIELYLDENPESVIVSVDGIKRHSLNECSIKSETNAFCIDVSQLGFEDSNAHTIQVMLGKKVLETLNFFVAQKLKVALSSSYVFDQPIILTVKHNGETVDSRKIANDIDFVDIGFLDGTLKVDVPYVRFAIDEETFYSPLALPLWKKQIHSGSLLRIDNNTSFAITISCNGMPLKEKEADIYRLLLSNEMLSDDFSIKIGNFKDILLFQVQKEECLKPFSVENIIGADNKRITIDTQSFVGDANPQYLISFTNPETKATFEYRFSEGEEIDASAVEDAYYVVNLYLIKDDFGEETLKPLATISDNDEFFLGNENIGLFNNCLIVLESTKSSKKKVKLENCQIRSITYVGEDNHVVYKGVLLFGRNKMKIVFDLKTEPPAEKGYLRIWIDDEQSRRLINTDIKNNSLTTAKADGNNIEECRSCYFRKEACNV
jgi:hypothetical protein